MRHLKVLIGNGFCDSALDSNILLLQVCIASEKLLDPLDGLFLEDFHLGLHSLQVFLVKFIELRLLEQSVVIKETQFRRFLQQVLFDLVLEHIHFFFGKFKLGAYLQ